MDPIYDIIRRRLGYKFLRLGSTANNLFFKMIPRHFKAEIFPNIYVRLDSNDITQRTTYWQGMRFEYPTLDILAEWVTPSITHFFDIGANYGFFSYLILSRFREVSVHAFEPNPAVFSLLQETKEANNLDRLNAHFMGLSDEEGSLFLHPGTSDTGSSTFGEHPDQQSKCENATPVDSFDHWRQVSQIQLPNSPRWLAKIDVEGYDLKVLKGMAQSLEARAFAGLIVEICENTLAFTGAKPEDILSFMESIGYSQQYPLGKWKTNGNAFFIPRPG